ncbi:YbaK/EbsC family protein [Natronorarus salvus]|uniref:YbaK/EbsC family protein n=1 Tax=Natronorarus salvus TaxID=3117733 RepID=UPI002F263F1B
MHPRTEAFRDRARDEHDIKIEVREFPEGTKTAADAAEAVGCEVAQIASSIVMDADGDLVVVVTSGANRVNEDRIAEVVGAESVEMADADGIRETLGWSIGGVPPICHDSEVPVLFDETLLEHDVVWTAAGTPEAVFPIDPEELHSLAGARPTDVVD